MTDTYRAMDQKRGEDTRAMDAFAHALTTIDEPHRMVHDGFSFHATSRVVSLANAASHNILLAVPAGSFPHLRAMLVSLSDSPVDIESFEGTTTSADGTVITPFNRNRNSTNTPGVVLTHTPTISADGTQIHDRFVPDAGGQGSNDVGVVTPNLGEEWILAPSTKYLIRVTNNSGGAITISYEVLWYEIDYDENTRITI